MNDGQVPPAAPGGVAGSFDEVVLPHLDAAYRLARWLMRDEHDAEDVVQEASLRAFRYFRTFSGGSGRAWFLRIVRNTCYGWHSHAGHASTDPFDEQQHSGTLSRLDPETLLSRADDVRLIELAMSDLPDRFRQVLVLREFEGLSYRELAEVMDIPMGTVMSGLSRARQAFRTALSQHRQRIGTAARTHPRKLEADGNARVTACAGHADSAAPPYPGRHESLVQEYSGAPAD